MTQQADSSTPSNPDPPVTGFRLDLRRALYPAYRDEVEGGLLPEEVSPAPASVPRVRLVTWIEGLVAAGCHFSPDDLSPQLWEHLAALKFERNRFERVVMEQNMAEGKRKNQEARVRNDARRLDAIPPPGVSLFASKGGR